MTSLFNVYGVDKVKIADFWKYFGTNGNSKVVYMHVMANKS